MNVSKYYYKDKTVKEYLEAAEEVNELRNDITYYAFFDHLFLRFHFFLSYNCIPFQFKLFIYLPQKTMI